MELSIILEYGWVLLVLVLLEGLLATDNALVLAIMVRSLPIEQRKKALFYGLVGAFIFRFLSLFAISYLVDIWQVQALGAIYLLFMSINHIVRKVIVKGKGHAENKKNTQANPNFWLTVLKVEVADIAFAIDSILAAIVLALSLPKTSLPKIGGIDGGQFIVIFLGGFIGLIIMRYAANIFVNVLDKRPKLEIAAFAIVGWVGVKLAILTLSHPDVSIINEHFSHSLGWKLSFYIVLILIAVVGWFTSGQDIDNKKSKDKQKAS